MSETRDESGSPAGRKIPIDVWAVALALALVALVRLGWLPAIGW